MPLGRAVANAGPNRVERDVAVELEQVSVGLDEHGVISALKEMPRPIPPVVERLSVGALQALHARGEIRLWSREKEVEVRPHQAVRMAHPAIASHDTSKHRQERTTVRVIPEHQRRVVAMGRDVVGRSWSLDSRRSWHELKLDALDLQERRRDALNTHPVQNCLGV